VISGWITFVAVALLFAAHRTADPDLPWHLRTGQLAVDTRSTLPTDPFSYSFAGAPWRAKDLLADVVLYLASAAFGPAFMTVLHFAAALAYPLLLRLALPPERRRPIVVLGASVLALCGFGMAERPQLFAHLAFLALLVSFDRAHRRLAEGDAGRALVGALWPLIVVEWAWVWLHRSALLGLALGLLFPLRLAASRLGEGRGASWRALFGPSVSRRAVFASAIAGIGSLALAPLNPSGFALFTSALALARSKVFRLVIADFMPIGLGGYFRLDGLGAAVTSLALVGALVRVAWAMRRPPREPPTLQLWHALLMCAFVALLWDAARWLQFAALTAGVVLVHLGAEAVEALRARPRPWPASAGWLALPVMLAAAVVHRSAFGPIAVGDDASVRPAGALAFAREHGLRGEVVTPLYLGGYVLAHGWPDVLVDVDGRNDEVYPRAFVVRAILSDDDPQVFGEMRREDGATWVIASNLPGHVTHHFLASDPDWAMVYWSDAAVVYALRSAHPELEPWRFRVLRDPHAIIVDVQRALREGGDRALVHEELGRMLAESPNSVRAGAALCLALHLEGPASWPRRDEVLRDLRILAPHHPLVEALEREIAGTVM
jgi:hypothetical protein